MGGEKWAGNVLPTGLRRLVAIDLKLREFELADKTDGLLLALAGTARAAAWGGAAAGAILCAGKSDEHVELLRLSETGIRVAAYLTELPPRELMAQKLHEAVRAARARLEGLGEGADRESR